MRYECAICGKKDIYDKAFGKHIKKHGYSPKEYYHKFVIKSNEIPKCKQCGSTLEFRKLSNPYGEFCSESCRSTYTIKGLNSDSEFQLLCKEGQLKRLKDPEFLEFKREVARRNIKLFNLTSDDLTYLRSLMLATRNSRLTVDRERGIKERVLYFYLSDTSCEVGINDIVDSIYMHRLKWIYDIHNLVLFRGDSKEIIEMEYQIKLRFIEFLNFDRSMTESFENSKYQEILNYAQNYISSTTIEKLDQSIVDLELSRVETSVSKRRGPNRVKI